MPTTYNPFQIQSIYDRSFFFDANILIFIFWPTASKTRAGSYSSIFSQLLKQKSKLYVDFITLSETINRVIRLEYTKHLNKEGLYQNDFGFKNYRNSKEGIDVVKDVYEIVHNSIIKNFLIAEKSFSKNEIESYLRISQLDFNDKAIIDICKENNCILVTNDFDFANSNIEILTSNPLLLKS